MMGKSAWGLYVPRFSALVIRDDGSMLSALDYRLGRLFGFRYFWDAPVWFAGVRLFGRLWYVLIDRRVRP